MPLDFIRSVWDWARYLVEQTAQTLNWFCRYGRDPQMVLYMDWRFVGEFVP